MARILITGGAGYVGSHCAKALATAGHEAIVFVSMASGHREFLRWGPLVEGGIRVAEALDALFRVHRIDAVMHFAVLAYVGESVTEPGRYYDVNIQGTRTLLDTTRRSTGDRILLKLRHSWRTEPRPDRRKHSAQSTISIWLY
jgi:UDP-arabinose 4-epimerase